MTPIILVKEVSGRSWNQLIIEPIRGGTDESKISFYGDSNTKYLCRWWKYAYRFEYVSLQTMEIPVDTNIGIVTKNEKQKRIR